MPYSYVMHKLSTEVLITAVYPHGDAPGLTPCIT